MRAQRGFALSEVLLTVVIVALVVAALAFAYRIVDFHADVRGLANAFLELEKAEQIWLANGGSADYTFSDLQDSQLASAFVINADGDGSYAGLPYFFNRLSTPAGFSTKVSTKAKAQQITSLLGGKATYQAEGSAFLITYQPQYLEPLSTLVDTSSIHTTTTNDNSFTALAFRPEAQVRLGDTCGFRDGSWLGGLAIDQVSHKLAVCKRQYADASRPERTWQLAGGRVVAPPVTPPKRQVLYCGTVGVPYDGNCCACTSLELRQVVEEVGDLQKIVVSCSLQPSCGDGTKVCDVYAECKTCQDGRNIAIAGVCSTLNQCGDGTIVSNPATECQTCSDGTNIAIGSVCPTVPVLEYCDDGLAVADVSECINCWHGTIAPYSRCRSLTTCGNGTVVSDASTDCKDCWDSTNVARYESCPDKPVLASCDDGTLVGALEQCKQCWHGTVGPSATCLVQPTCGDGTPVIDVVKECKTCPNGMNQAVNSTCEALVDCSCGGTAKTLAECPVISMKSCGGGCPNVCPDESCSTPAETGPSTCGSGYELTSVEGSCAIEHRCVKLADPCPCNGVRDVHGKCPAVVKTRHQVSCPAGYDNVSDETECAIHEKCVKQCPCDGGSETFPNVCPPITMKSCEDGCQAVCPAASCAVPERTGPTTCGASYTLQETTGNCMITSSCVKNLEPCPCGMNRESDGTCPTVVKNLVTQICAAGYTKQQVETECSINEICVKDCPCGGGQVKAPDVCPTITKVRRSVICPVDYTKVVSETECEINESCVKQCPCGGPTVTLPEVCPAVTKGVRGPAACTTGYSRVKQSEDACSITYACVQSCACSGTTATFPDACPLVVKSELGKATCPSGFQKVKVAETACTVTHECVYVCPNGDQVNDRSACRTKSCPCDQADVLEGETCPPVQKRIVGATSCPVATGFSWITVNEDACTIQKSCLCTVTPTTCWTGPNACANPRQIWVTDIHGVSRTGFYCESEGNYY